LIADYNVSISILYQQIRTSTRDMHPKFVEHQWKDMVRGGIRSKLCVL
jgi:hypothetical protein